MIGEGLSLGRSPQRPCTAHSAYKYLLDKWISRCTDTACPLLPTPTTFISCLDSEIASWPSLLLSSLARGIFSKLNQITVAFLVSHLSPRKGHQGPTWLGSLLATWLYLLLPSPCLLSSSHVGLLDVPEHTRNNAFALKSLLWLFLLSGPLFPAITAN